MFAISSVRFGRTNVHGGPSVAICFKILAKLVSKFLNIVETIEVGAELIINSRNDKFSTFIIKSSDTVHEHNPAVISTLS